MSANVKSAQEEIGIIPKIEVANAQPPKVEVAKEQPPKVEVAKEQPPKTEVAKEQPPKVGVAKEQRPKVEAAKEPCWYLNILFKEAKPESKDNAVMEQLGIGILFNDETIEATASDNADYADTDDDDDDDDKDDVHINNFLAFAYCFHWTWILFNYDCKFWQK